MQMYHICDFARIQESPREPDPVLDDDEAYRLEKRDDSLEKNDGRAWWGDPPSP